MVENDQEFIPAVTHDVIAFPHGLPQVLGNGHEHLVADGMPELIVDFLKAVHIHHDEGEVVGMIGVDDLFKEIPTVVGPRQFVRINLLLVFVNDIDDRAATEAAAVASLYVMFLGFFVYGTLRVRDLPAIFWNTVEQTAKVMFVIATAGFFQYVLLYTRIPQQAIAFMSTSFATAAPVLLLIIALLVLMGCFMEGTAILLITVPIFVPLAKSFGYDIVQLGIVMCISLAIGVLTPPVGLNLYVMSSITGEHVLAIAKEAVGYVLIMIIVAILVAFIPELSLGFAKWVP